MPLMRLLLLCSLAPLVLASCDKKEPAPAANGSVPAPTSTPSTPAPTMQASSSSSGGGPSVFAGACAALAKDKTARCNKLSAGDPTVKKACEDGIDGMVAGGDDMKCHAAANPPPASAPTDLGLEEKPK